jgi:hypothetical protein
MISQAGNRLADITQYTSYEITVHLEGKQRTYRAMVLYHAGSVGKAAYQTEQARSARLAGIEVLDNVTAELNTVLKDESPRLRSPWAKYSKSTLYRAVIRNLNATSQQGNPLIPANAPIGYLPGDDVTPTQTDTTMMMESTSCQDLRILRDGNDITDRTGSVVIGERINLSLETNPEGGDLSNIQWTIGGTKIAGFVVNGTGPTGASTGTATDLTAANLQSPTLTYYWTKPGQGIEVSITATVFGTSITKSAHFDVTAPSATQPTVTVANNGQLFIRNLGDCSGGSPGPALVFGDISGPSPGTCSYSGTAGIRFTPPTSTSPPGHYLFVQLITGDTVTYSRTGATTTCSSTASPGLDGNYPYQNATGTSVADAPFVPLPSTYTTVSRNFGATMYMMWQSNITGSIPVSLGSVVWSVNGSTSEPQPNTTWGTPTGSGSAQQFAAASGLAASFPNWSALQSMSCH